MPKHKASRLEADIQGLVEDLRQRASKALQDRAQSIDPYDRGEALGYASALAYAAERLETLLASYLSTLELSPTGNEGPSDANPNTESLH
jgi:hypothetical protein